MTAKVLLVDNYDSFTYNLAHYLAELGAEVAVRRPEQLNGNLEHTHLVLSPGPGRPSEQLVGLVRGSRVPTLGVCLGHQAIVQTFGAPETVPAGKHARSTSNEDTSSRTTPCTSETRCVMCENRSASARSIAVSSAASLFRHS